MPKQFLHAPDVVTVFQQVRRERMPEHVRAHPLRETGSTRRGRDFLLYHRLVEVKPRGRSPLRVAANPRGRKHELPGPVRGGVGVFAGERERQDGTSVTLRQVALVLALHFALPKSAWIDGRGRLGGRGSGVTETASSETDCTRDEPSAHGTSNAFRWPSSKERLPCWLVIGRP